MDDHSDGDWLSKFQEQGLAVNHRVEEAKQDAAKRARM
jgi:hypothetical protein